MGGLPSTSISPNLSKNDQSQASFTIQTGSTFGSSGNGLVGGSTGFSTMAVVGIVGAIIAVAGVIWFFFFRD
jgi:hypothetical protein